MNTETVAIPQEHAGVGDALRAAFLPCATTMPDDLAALIEKLR